jgi:hypothetical protein
MQRLEVQKRGGCVVHKIEVDDEVFALLQRHAQPFVDRENDVLRRLLLGEPAAGRSADTSAARNDLGVLMPYLDAGLLEPNDELVHEQPRKGLVHRAHVTRDGCVEVAGNPPFRNVSPALKFCVGHDINGWDHWTHVRTGRRLRELREELRQLQSG